MTRASIAAGVALLAFGALGAPAVAQPVLQPEDRGGPGYTTGTTMGREGVPSPAPSSAGSPSSDRRPSASAEHRRTRRVAPHHPARNVTAGASGGSAPGAAH